MALSWRRPRPTVVQTLCLPMLNQNLWILDAHLDSDWCVSIHSMSERDRLGTKSSLSSIMSDAVEPRLGFIEKHTLDVKNLGV